MVSRKKTIIVLALICGTLTTILGIGGYRYGQRKSLVRRIQKAGGDVTYQDRWFLPRVEEAYLVGQENADPLVQELWRFRSLKMLRIQPSHVSDESLRTLAGMKDLQELDLNWTSVSDAGIAHLTKLPNLKTIMIMKSHPPLSKTYCNPSQLTGQSIEHLAKTPSLEKVIFWGAELSDADLAKMKSCPNLKEFWLIDCRLSNQSISGLQELHSLEYLDLSDNEIDDQAMAVLTKMPNLNYLSLARTKVSTEAANTFFAQRGNNFSIGL